jgi:hypothetical protein
MKLLLAGLALLSAGLGIVLFTYYDPATLFIAGAVCTFLGIINLLSLSYGLGAGVSANDTSDAKQLIRDIRNHS